MRRSKSRSEAGSTSTRFGGFATISTSFGVYPRRSTAFSSSRYQVGGSEPGTCSTASCPGTSSSSLSTGSSMAALATEFPSTITSGLRSCSTRATCSGEPMPEREASSPLASCSISSARTNGALTASGVSRAKVNARRLRIRGAPEAAWQL